MVMAVTDSSKHGARKGQKTINKVRNVLFFILSLNRTCSQSLLSFVGHCEYKRITSFVKEITSYQMLCFTLHYG